MSTSFASPEFGPGFLPQSSRASLTTALAVLAIALAVRVIHVWQMRDTLFFSVLMGDSRGYDAWAREIAAGDWVGREVFYQAPLYPYFLAAIYTGVGHDLFAVRLVQALLGAGACALLADAVARTFSRRAGLLAGLMLALYAPAIFFDALIQKSVLDIFLLCLALAVLARIVSDPRAGGTKRTWIALGLVLGALTLTRENAILLAVIVAGWAGLGAPGAPRGPGALGAPGARALAFFAGMAIVLLPVAARNYMVGGGFHLTTSQFGSNLYIGNNPRADGSYVSLREGRGSPEFERVDATELAEQAAGRRLTPGEVSSYWTGQTWTYIQSQPQHWLALLLRKVRLLASRTEVIDTESQESHAEHSWPLRVLGRLWHFGILLPLAIVGVVVTWPRRHALAVFYALAASYALSVIVFYVVARYRLPWVPLLIPFAAAGVLALPRVGASALATAAIVAIVSNWPTHTAASQLAITENNLGTALQGEGRVDEAIARYRRALEFNPQYAPALNNLGTALRAKGHTEEALATYDSAIASGAGDHATVYVNRGNALMQQGRTAEAVASFRQALAVDPRSSHARSALANALYDMGTEAIERSEFSNADTMLREAITLRPDYAEAHNNLGIALASQGRLDDAVMAWEAALRLKPGLADARRNLEMARRAPR